MVMLLLSSCRGWNLVRYCGLYRADALAQRETRMKGPRPKEILNSAIGK